MVKPGMFAALLLSTASSAVAGEMEVSLGGRRIPLEDCRISAMPFNRIWTGRQRTLDQTRLAKFASFDLAEPGTLEISGVGAEVPARLYPFSESNRLERVEGGLRLKLDRPSQYVLDFGDALPPLHVFADRPFDIERRPDDIWFGPGEHHAGIISPRSGQRVVVERGAVVHGELFLCEVTNVAVVGRGILDCSTFERADVRAQEFRKSHGLPPVDTEFACHSCVVYASENVLIEGIVIRDTPFWSLIVRSGSRNVTIDGVKVVGQWRYNSDGIDISASSDVHVKNCFVRSFDDCLVVLGAYLDTRSYLSENILFEDCRLWCDWGAVFKLWSPPYTNTFRNVAFRDSVLMNVVGVPLQVKDACGSENTVIEDVRFSGLEFDLDDMPLASVLQKSDDMRYPGDSRTKEVVMALVACLHPKKDFGNQNMVDVEDVSGYHSAIRSVSFEDFSFPGIVPPLAATLTTTVPGQEIRDVAFRSVPSLSLRKSGCVNSVSVSESSPAEAVPPERLEARRQFADLKFGIFIHWGFYATYAQGEWYLERAGLRGRDYEHAANAFYPHDFDAMEWCRAFKSAGANYVVFTSRHHDGFSMFGTKATDYNVVDKTPFRRDVVKELADACRACDLKLGLYYSLLDWHRPDYPTGVTTKARQWVEKGKEDYDSYLAFMKRQLTELLTNYGDILCIWFDGEWDHKDPETKMPNMDWKYDEIYSLIHTLQPRCLVLNNHHHALRDGEDIYGVEREKKDGKKHPFSIEPGHPGELCDTMVNGAFGYKVTDTDWKTADEIRAMLKRVNGRGMNLLLNIAPRADGKLPDEAMKILDELAVGKKEK